MRTLLWLAAFMVTLAGCSDDASPSEDQDDTPGPGDGAPADPDAGTGDEPDAVAFEPVYINGTLSQNLADCSDPSGALAGGSSHALPDGAAGRSYSVTVVSAGDVPTESLCVSFDSGSASTSGTIPDDATSINVGGDFAVGTAYSIYID